MKRVITKDRNVWESFSELILKKDLLILLTRREIFLRYKHAPIAIMWGVLRPLLLAYVISQSFGKIVGNIYTPYYFLSIFLGFIFWNYFSSTIGKASGSLIGYRSLIKNAAFPHIMLPLSKMGVGLIDFFIALTVALLLALFLGLPLHFLFLWCVCISILLITTISIGILLAGLFATYTDLTELTSFFISLLFFLTPVVYPVHIIPLSWQTYIYLNPMAGVIETAKAALFSPTAIHWQGLWISGISSLVLLSISLFLFERMDKTVADSI